MSQHKFFYGFTTLLDTFERPPMMSCEDPKKLGHGLIFLGFMFCPERFLGNILTTPFEHPP